LSTFVLSPHQKLYVALAAVFVSCLLIGDIIGGKTFATPLGPVSVGMIPFPITFLLTDVVNDFYGKKGARFLTIVAFCMAGLAWLILQLWKALTESKHLWLRATGSTILSQLLDTATINIVFWKWTASKEWTWIFAKIGREYGIKLVVAICLTPVVYAIHGGITHLLKIEPEKLARPAK
jgi:uncharacterized PurR-regulated membrane protein YhhQ (DUF165 family)